MRKSQSLLSSGTKKIKASDNVVLAYTCLLVPVGSKCILVKDKEIELINPVIHTETKKGTDGKTYTYTETLLTVSNPLDFYTLIYSNDIYYTINHQLSTNENSIYHYKLDMIDLANILIKDSIEDVDLSQVYDVTSIPLLLQLFTQNNIDVVPESLFILNKDLLSKKLISIRVLESKTLSQGFSKEIPRVDKIRLFYNNYSRIEIMKVFELFDKLMSRSELNVFDRDNVYNIKELSNDGLVNRILYYSDFTLNYNLTDDIKLDSKIYLEKIMMLINSDINISIDKKKK